MHQLKCRYYLRYCDDFVLLSPEREQLLAWREQIAIWLREQRRLELNAKRQRLRPVSNGVDFLGYIVRSDYWLVRQRVVNHLRVRLREYQAQLVEEDSDCRRYHFDRALLDRLHATLASYLGHLQQANTYHLCQALWEDHPFLARYFDFDPQARTLVCNYLPPRGVRNIRQQYRYYRRRFPDTVLFFQVGRFIEFYQPGDKVTADWLGLAPLSANRRGARYGFP